MWSGNDDMIVPLMSLRGDGVISVIANVAPKDTHDLVQLFLDGKYKESTDLQLDMNHWLMHYSARQIRFLLKLHLILWVKKLDTFVFRFLKWQKIPLQD